MRRVIAISIFAVYVLVPFPALWASEIDPALQAAEAVYWQDGAAAALPKNLKVCSKPACNCAGSEFAIASQ